MPNKLLQNDFNHLKNKPSLDAIPDGTTRKLISSAEQSKITNLPDNTILELSKKLGDDKIGVPNGIAKLDANGNIPVSQLPGFVDDVLDFPNVAVFPAVGESGKLYTDQLNNDVYRWSGTTYVKIGGSDLNKHLADQNNPHKVNKGQVGLADVDNTADVNKPVSAPQQTALNLKLDKSEKNQPNGYVGLDATSKLDAAYLPSNALTVIVDNLTTADATKALSSNMGKTLSNMIAAHKSDASNPHHVNKTDVGLSNADNTRDIDKPVSTSTQGALNLKIDKSKLGSNNGVATLDATGRLLATQIPSGLKVDVDNNLTSTDITHALSAKMGKLLNDNKESKLGTPPADDYILSSSAAGIRKWVAPAAGATIEDTLTSNSTTSSLSANQGKLLDYKKMDKSVKGAPNGVAPLGSNGKIPDSNLPDTALTKIDDVLTSASSTHALSARMGKVLEANKADKNGNAANTFDVATPLGPNNAASKSYVDSKAMSGGVTITDTLLSASSTDALSANQGRVLKSLVDSKETKLGNPGADGYVLSSTTSGARSWVPKPTGGGSPLTKADLDNSSSTKFGLVSGGLLWPYFYDANNNAGVRIGLDNLNNVTTGSKNTAMGRNSAMLMGNGSDNVTIGYNALRDGTSVSRTVAVGSDAAAHSNQKELVAVGYQALMNTSGQHNTGIGAYALTTNTSGEHNTALGHNALSQNNTGNMNTALGDGSLEKMVSGHNNTAVGNATLINNSGGSSNVAVGNNSLQSTPGKQNTAVGFKSFNMTIDNGNTGFGYRSGEKVRNGDRNVIMGFFSAPVATYAKQCTLLGAWTADSESNLGTNNTLIGYNAKLSASGVSNEITLGNANITSLRCKVNSITATSDLRLKENIKPIKYGLDFVLGLKPKSFTWKSDNNYKTQVGFIAQDFQKLIDTQENPKELRDANLLNDSNPDRYEITEGKLIPILVQTIHDMNEKMEKLEKRIITLEIK